MIIQQSIPSLLMEQTI